jgi:hypothetical protein
MQAPLASSLFDDRRVIGEAVEKVGTVKMSVVIIPASRARSKLDSNSSRVLNHPAFPILAWQQMRFSRDSDIRINVLGVSGGKVDGEPEG